MLSSRLKSKLDALACEVTSSQQVKLVNLVNNVP